MAEALGLLLLSFFITSILLVPFIDLLYRYNFRRRKQTTLDCLDKQTKVFDKLHNWKSGVPIGGGVLVIGVVTFLAFWAYALLGEDIMFWEVFVLLFTFIGFGVLGAFDDVKKMFNRKSGFFGLRMRYKLIMQIILSLIIGCIFYFALGYNFIYIQWLGQINIGPLFILLAGFCVTSFANAYNITDGLDGLASGLLMICLFAFWAIASAFIQPSLAIFIAIWLGALIAFLYFNVYPARIYLGDTGSLSFGATLAVVGLLTGKVLALAIIGGVFVVEVASSLIQIVGKYYLKKKLLKLSPVHLYLQSIGWEEPKIVMRAWLAGIVLAVFGLWLALM